MKLIVILLTGLILTLSQVSVYAGPNDRQDRREERGRSDERQDKRDCRHEEGLVGEDKRECKQEEVHDGARGRRDKDDELDKVDD